MGQSLHLFKTTEDESQAQLKTVAPLQFMGSIAAGTVSKHEDIREWKPQHTYFPSPGLYIPLATSNSFVRSNRIS